MVKNLSKWHVTYLNIAKEIGKHSYSERKKVGAILVKDDRIISTGYNGTPSGFDNTCEDIINNALVTKREVLHAESNAISKCAKSTESSEGAILYVTLSPCYECAKLIIQAGITQVFFSELYRDTEGLLLLSKANVYYAEIKI